MIWYKAAKDKETEQNKIRAKSEIRTPDAIQIGTSIHSDADYFLTNDKRLKSVEDIPIIILEDFV